MQAIQLIVGLCNPGPDYDRTRHNAGAWFVERLAEQENRTFSTEKKFQGQVCQLDQPACHLLLPNTFMNHSGQSVKAITQFYKIDPASVLIAHDELDLPVGVVKLKMGGGHGGHNGLRDVISHIGSQFWRLRVGIGHPGDRNRVLDYVLGRPSVSDEKQIDEAIADALQVMPMVARGEMQKAMNELHS